MPSTDMSISAEIQVEIKKAYRYYTFPGYKLFDTDVFLLQVLSLAHYSTNIFYHIMSLAQNTYFDKNNMKIKLFNIIMYVLNDEVSVLNLLMSRVNIETSKDLKNLIIETCIAIAKKVLINALQMNNFPSLESIKEVLGLIFTNKLRIEDLMGQVADFDVNNQGYKLKQSYKTSYDPYIFHRFDDLALKFGKNLAQKFKKEKDFELVIGTGIGQILKIEDELASSLFDNEKSLDKIMINMIDKIELYPSFCLRVIYLAFRTYDKLFKKVIGDDRDANIKENLKLKFIGNSKLIDKFRQLIDNHEFSDYHNTIKKLQLIYSALQKSRNDAEDFNSVMFGDLSSIINPQSTFAFHRPSNQIDIMREYKMISPEYLSPKKLQITSPTSNFSQLLQLLPKQFKSPIANTIILLDEEEGENGSKSKDTNRINEARPFEGKSDDNFFINFDLNTIKRIERLDMMKFQDFEEKRRKCRDEKNNFLKIKDKFLLNRDKQLKKFASDRDYYSRLIDPIQKIINEEIKPELKKIDKTLLNVLEYEFDPYK